MHYAYAAVGLLLVSAATALADPPRSAAECEQRIATVRATVQQQRVSDSLQERIDEELGRARRDCAAALFAEADEALSLADRIARGERDVD